MLRFTCDEKKLVEYQEVITYYDNDCLQNIFLLFVSFLTAPVIKNSHILAEPYFTFRKQCPGPNLNISQYQIWTSVKISEKYLSSKTNFSTFFAT